MLELEVGPIDQRGPMTTGSGRHGFDVEKFAWSISRKRKQILLWLNIKYE